MHWDDIRKKMLRPEFPPHVHRQLDALDYEHWDEIQSIVWDWHFPDHTSDPTKDEFEEWDCYVCNPDWYVGKKGPIPKDVLDQIDQELKKKRDSATEILVRWLAEGIPIDIWERLSQEHAVELADYLRHKLDLPGELLKKYPQFLERMNAEWPEWVFEVEYNLHQREYATENAWSYLLEGIPLEDHEDIKDVFGKSVCAYVDREIDRTQESMREFLRNDALQGSSDSPPLIEESGLAVTEDELLSEIRKVKIKPAGEDADKGEKK